MRTNQNEEPLTEHFMVTSTGDVQLSTLLWQPRLSGQEKEADKTPAVVFVHPWGKMGGCAELMHGMAYLLSSSGISCVTFDLRGVRSSTGNATYGCYEEIDDVVRISEWVSEKLSKKVVIVASSAGASTGGSALDRLDCISGAILIGYTFGFWASVLFGRHFKNVLESEKPKRFIMGTKDEFTGVKTFQKYYARCKSPKSQALVQGVGHFELEGPNFDQYMIDTIIQFINEYAISS
mmetsp:Transcript_16336/g.21598  ORF Transcript_16336/g.21598 Transcript_16336/m.21598 type:complete len:236 (+) Transcript_16336:219-926(+)